MTKHTISVKDPDIAQDIIHAQAKGESDDADKKRQAFSAKYFEHGEYFYIEIDDKTLACKLVPIK